MNTITIVFAACLIAVHGSNVGRVNTGWGSPASINVDLAADAQAIGAGEAYASQATAIDAQGTLLNPAVIDAQAQTAATVNQGIAIDQIAIIDGATNQASTINLVEVQQQTAAVDILGADVTAGISTVADNSGESLAGGWGQVSAGASSSNVVNT